jgi:hypothetical protein
MIFIRLLLGVLISWLLYPDNHEDSKATFSDKREPYIKEAQVLAAFQELGSGYQGDQSVGII